MSVLTVADLRARCVIDQATHCWLWTGAASGGQPRIWTLDYARAEKRCMSGPLAAWNIAFQKAPRRGHIVYRGCMQSMCLNPAHLRQAPDLAAIGAHIRLAGTRRGTAVEARRANIAKAQRASGITPTPNEIVLAIRSAPKRHGIGRELARLHDVSEQVVSSIRRGTRRQEVV